MTDEKIDVEACVRLLKELRLAFAEDAKQYAVLGDQNNEPSYTEQAVAAERKEALVSALASALPGMGKDSERVDALAAHVQRMGGMRFEKFRNGWVYGQSSARKDQGYGTSRQTVRELLDFFVDTEVAREFKGEVPAPSVEELSAARAAQPEETKP